MTSGPEPRIVISTRQEQASGPFASRLTAADVHLRSIPATVWAAGPDLDSFRGCVASLDAYDVVAFTSPRAVDAVCSLPEAARHLASRPHARIAVVGPATALCAQRHGIAVDVRPRTAGGAALAAELLASGAIRAGKVLWPRALDPHSAFVDALRREGVTVDGFAVYRTLPAAPDRLADLTRAVVNSHVAAVCFFSPSAVASVAPAFDEGCATLERRSLVASLGASTTRALRQWGVSRVLEASRPDAGVFAAELLQALDLRGGRV